MSNIVYTVGIYDTAFRHVVIYSITHLISLLWQYVPESVCDFLERSCLTQAGLFQLKSQYFELLRSNQFDFVSGNMSVVEYRDYETTCLRGVMNF